ncbi:MAG: 50S ribosomal protein L7/L12 [Armatimonadetes bacterium]|nr:50S ribosomal protein L7/L12 [Armatimonadota bacterium]
MTKEEFIEAIKAMTVLELKELVDAIKEEFGVTAAMPVMAGMMPGVAAGGAAEAEEEPTEFNVVITSAGEQRIQVIKVVRELVSGLGLKEAKALVESAPDAVVEENVSKERGQEIKAKLEEVGATVELKPAG